MNFRVAFSPLLLLALLFSCKKRSDPNNVLPTVDSPIIDTPKHRVAYYKRRIEGVWQWSRTSDVWLNSTGVHTLRTYDDTSFSITIENDTVVRLAPNAHPLIYRTPRSGGDSLNITFTDIYPFYGNGWYFTYNINSDTLRLQLSSMGQGGGSVLIYTRK